MTRETNHDRYFAFTEDERAYLREGLEREEALLSPYATRHAQAIYERDGGRRDGARRTSSATSILCVRLSCAMSTAC